MDCSNARYPFSLSLSREIIYRSSCRINVIHSSFINPIRKIVFNQVKNSSFIHQQRKNWTMMIDNINYLSRNKITFFFFFFFIKRKKRGSSCYSLVGSSRQEKWHSFSLSTQKEMLRVLRYRRDENFNASTLT